MWRSEEIYPTSNYYIRVVAASEFGNTTSEFHFDAMKSGIQSNRDNASFSSIHFTTLKKGHAVVMFG